MRSLRQVTDNVPGRTWPAGLLRLIIHDLDYQTTSIDQTKCRSSVAELYPTWIHTIPHRMAHHEIGVIGGTGLLAASAMTTSVGLALVACAAPGPCSRPVPSSSADAGPRGV
jgi:hypothetical protein